MKDMKKQKYETGAEREENNDKGRFDLLPPKAVLRVAKRFQEGAKKYSDNNWEKGMPEWRFIDSALRHIFQHMENKNNEDHLAAACANLMMLMGSENDKNNTTK